MLSSGGEGVTMQNLTGAINLFDSDFLDHTGEVMTLTFDLNLINSHFSPSSQKL